MYNGPIKGKMDKGNNMYVQEFDFDCDLGLGEFLEILEKYKATILKFVSFGPGGGNPSVWLRFETAADIDAFSEFMEN